MPKIHIPQKNLTLSAPVGVNLMAFLRDSGIPLASSCLGDGICGKCRVAVKANLPPPSNLEIETLTRNKAAATERLACQIIIETEIALTTTYW